MRRREFITAIAGAAIAWARAARAQQPTMRTIGVLVRAAPGWQRFWKMFPAALHDLGYSEGQNIRFELRSDDGQISRLPELATELARLKVDVIVSWFTPAAIAANRRLAKFRLSVRSVATWLERDWWRTWRGQAEM